MFGLFLAISGVCGLVGYAIRRSTGPSQKPLDERIKLERLKLRQVLTLDEAEDGLVLARRYGDKSSEVRFRIEVLKLKKRRLLV
jgi:hypothetical protein